MRVLIVGGGGREHAIAWALRKSSEVGALFVAPGNAGTESIATNVPISDRDIPELVDFAQQSRIDLAVIGPETPLAMGIVDAMQAAEILAFGPKSVTAQLEASKVFSKAFMQKNNIPTADYGEFSDYDEAVRFIESFGRPVVVKADGLAAGKGVIVCDDVEQAKAALRQILLDGAFGQAGSRVVVEERLTGREVSVLAFSDGNSLVMMPAARDHKRIFDNDAGPNTGGMGAYAPVPGVAPELLDHICCTVLQPAVDGMAARGTPYVGVLYAGMILTPDGPRTLEFNCRFGDPETQVILPLLETDLLAIIQACIEGRLHELDVRWQAGACATVVVASPGYPGSYPKGLPVTGLDDVKDSIVFHAGTARDADGRVVTSGGRVLAVSGVGDDLSAALASAYDGISRIQFEGMHYRRDIGRTQ